MACNSCTPRLAQKPQRKHRKLILSATHGRIESSRRHERRQIKCLPCTVNHVFILFHRATINSTLPPQEHGQGFSAGSPAAADCDAHDLPMCLSFHYQNRATASAWREQCASRRCVHRLPTVKLPWAASTERCGRTQATH